MYEEGTGQNKKKTFTSNFQPFFCQNDIFNVGVWIPYLSESLEFEIR